MKKILASVAIAGVLVLGACSGGGDSGPVAPNIVLPLPSALPAYTASAGSPSNDTEALNIFKAAAAAIGSFSSSTNPAVMPMKGITSKNVTPKVVDSGDEKIGPFSFTNDTDMIPGAVSSGSIYMRNKWYFKNENSPMETRGDYNQFIMELSLNAQIVNPGITPPTSTMTIKGSFIYITDMNMKTVTDSYIDWDDYQYSTRFSMGTGIGYALSVSDTAGKGGKFIFSTSFAASGSFTETQDEIIGDTPTAGVDATLYVYDNSNNLLHTIEMTDEDVEDLFDIVM